jgi:magnesium transporter
MYYVIKGILTDCSKQEALSGPEKYVAVLTPEEWRREIEDFRMGIDLDMVLDAGITKAEVNYDSLTGTFAIPDRHNLSGREYRFAFACDERGIVFIDSSGVAAKLIADIQKSKKWRMPGLERFLYDFLERIISPDLALMEAYEKELNSIEDAVQRKPERRCLDRVNDIRGELLDLHTHYEQLLDLSQELEENENGFFDPDSLRYFHMFSNRVERLRDMLGSLREYTVLVRDLYQSELAAEQNHTMTILTVTSIIFMPLTLIVGWYGMNFRYMPELYLKYSYPVLILVCIVIVVIMIAWFRRRKWL